MRTLGGDGALPWKNSTDKSADHVMTLSLPALCLGDKRIWFVSVALFQGLLSIPRT